MKGAGFLLIILLCSSGLEPAAKSRPTASEILFEELGLDGRTSLDVFERAVEGFYGIADRRREVLTLIDFSKPSTLERLWVIDMECGKLLFSCHVAHGQGSGGNYATSFSNVSGSHQSSLGFFLTDHTYIGRNGYSLLIDGLEPGVNDNARARAVVIHGAAYANPSVIASAGRLGRSWGCPALPQALAAPVIDAIKDGSVIYIHGES
ncbi:MAG: murein L,D-transpeptidase catalytic domain family protein [Alistipes sp.]|jgi:hypothetical protein|nr:murein L,D-transpeptidase catalytic domain family protein [Alistipes sp.]